MRPGSRTPSARLIRARVLSAHWEESRPTHCYEDPLVLSYAKFLRDLDSLDGIQHDRYLALRPVLAELHYLCSATDTLSFEGRSRGPAALMMPRMESADVQAAVKDRALVRAFVLADTAPEEIADTLDLQAETIRLYEHLSWDVRSRLTKRAWLHNHVFGESMLSTTSVLDFERLCLLMVYRHGAEGLRRMLFLRPMTHQEFVDEMREQLRVDMASKAGLSLATMPLNSHTIPELVSGYNNWEKTERELKLREAGGGGAGGGASEETKDSISAALTSVGFTVPDGPVDSDNEDAEDHQGDEAFVRALRLVMQEVGVEEHQEVVSG